MNFLVGTLTGPVCMKNIQKNKIYLFSDSVANSANLLVQGTLTKSAIFEPMLWKVGIAPLLSTQIICPSTP